MRATSICLFGVSLVLLGALFFSWNLLVYVLVTVGVFEFSAPKGHVMFLNESCAFDPLTDEFPEYPGFIFGASTSAYQIEGAWNEEGRGPSVWDVATHDRPETIADGSNGDETCDSYHRFEEDVKALKDMGLHFYRLSFSWPRLMPSGETSSLNQAGVQYYHRVLDTLIANDIQPLVTLHHCDTPQPVQELGGLTNVLFADFFVEYADYVFRTYGSKVKHWVTINEPSEVCLKGYGDGSGPPFMHGGEYLCVKNVLISHARVYRLYDSKYRAIQNGRVGITLNTRFYYPKTLEDLDHSERAMQYKLGLFAHPIFSEAGSYPPLVLEEVARNSREEGRLRSRLQNLNLDEQTYVQGTADFFALNYYTSSLVSPDPDVASLRGWYRDFGLQYDSDPDWIHSHAWTNNMVPRGLRDTLRWIKREYGEQEVWILENGWPDEGDLFDPERVLYLQEHLKVVLEARKCDSVNVVAHFTWSLIDNFEWYSGYTEKYGLYHVNFSSPGLERTPKASSRFLRRVIETRRIND